MEKNNRKKANAGITLIALIITVIVMLILAGVAINLSIGENGIFKRTQEASEISKKASIKEDLELKIADLEFEKIKEGQTLTKEDIAERLTGMGVEVIDQTDKIIEGETEEYPIIIDENNKVTVGDKLTGAKPTGTVEILTKEEGVDEVEIRVTGLMEEGEITGIQAVNGAELKTEESTTSKIFKVTDNGTFYFRIKASNGRSTKVSCNVTNIIILTTGVDLLNAIEDAQTSGIRKVQVVGSENTETYRLKIIRHEGNMVLDGTKTYEGSTLENNVYTFGNENDVATSSTELAKNTVVLKVEGNLTINEGVTVEAVKSATGFGGPKGMVIYCTGTLTNNGRISMSQNGAYADGENIYLWKNQDETGGSGEFEYVPKFGAVGSGPAGLPGGNYTFVNPVANAHGTGRQTAGGASGAAARIGANNTNNIRGGNGGQGTSYSGGGGRRWNSNKRCSYRN